MNNFITIPGTAASRQQPVFMKIVINKSQRYPKNSASQYAISQLIIHKIFEQKLPHSNIYDVHRATLSRSLRRFRVGPDLPSVYNDRVSAAYGNLYTKDAKDWAFCGGQLFDTTPELHLLILGWFVLNSVVA